MLLVVLLSSLSAVGEEGWTPPPLVSAEPGREASQPPPPPRAAPEVKQETPKKPEPERDFPLWQVTALATANVPSSLDGSDFLLGLRGELDVWRIGAVVSFDRTGTTPLTMSDTRHWTGLAGYAVLLNRWVRVRALGGVSALTTDTSSTFGPSVGVTARVGWAFLGAEAAAVFTPVGFRQLDVRAEGILKGGVFELHAGYRARFLDASATGTLETMFSNAPVAGPHVAVGLSF
ncbi:MAG: hypothetical protein ACOZQL_26340 [Myxococcota bacterium]